MNTEDKLISAVLEAAGPADPGIKKRLTCSIALELAQEYKVEVIEIGLICNQYNIKICKCQLGCFP